MKRLSDQLVSDLTAALKYPSAGLPDELGEDIAGALRSYRVRASQRTSCRKSGRRFSA